MERAIITTTINISDAINVDLFETLKRFLIDHTDTNGYSNQYLKVTEVDDETIEVKCYVYGSANNIIEVLKAYTKKEFWEKESDKIGRIRYESLMNNFNHNRKNF